MPRGKKVSGVQEIDKKIADLEAQIEKLKEEKKAAILAEKSEKLLEIDTLIEESGMSIAQIKTLIKEQKKPAPKPKAKKKSLVEEIMSDWKRGDVERHPLFLCLFGGVLWLQIKN